MLIRKYLFKGLCPLVLLFSFVFQANTVKADDSTPALIAGDVTVTNNYGKPDTIYVTGVSGGDTVTVYNAATGGRVIGKGKVSGNNTSTQISIAQLGADAGAVYITDTSEGMTESSRTEVDYFAEPVSVDPSPDDITVTNNAGEPATIYVDNLGAGDMVKVYTAAIGGKLLTSATVGNNKTDVTLSLDKLDDVGGTLYVSVTSKGMHESDRITATYSAVVQSVAPDVSDVTVTNNVGKASTIYVDGLGEGDVVKVYNAATGGKLLTSRIVGSNATDVTLSVSNLGVAAGSVYLSVTSKGMTESSRTMVNYSGEGQSNPVSTSNVTITNNVGKAGTLSVNGLIPGDKLKIYNAEIGGSVLETATAKSDGTATVSLGQLGSDAGDVYISVTSAGMLESSRVQVGYSAENQSNTLDASNIVFNNNVGSDDTVQVSGVSAGAVINVYDAATGGDLLGTATVVSGETSATVSINPPGTGAGSVYVSVVDPNELESNRVEVDYFAQAQSDALDTSNIVVTNNVGASDTVQVSDISVGEVVNVYGSATGGNLLGTATVATGATSATISIPQLGTSAGSVYVSLVEPNKLESSRVQVGYLAEGKTSSISADDVIVTNNSGKADIVYVSGLNANDTVNVYDSAVGGNLLGTATVASDATSATVSISQLGTSAGNIYVSRISKNESESDRVQVAYSAIATTTELNANNIVVANNAGANETVQVSGVTEGEVINVYDSAVGGNLLGTATVASGETSATITTSQLSAMGGNIYVSLTDPNELESNRVEVDYSAEAQSDPVDVNNVTITNNCGAADTINLTGLSQNDIIKVYDSAQGGNLLGTATVASGDAKATISIAQLGTSAGNVYISRTSTNKTESSRVTVPYLAEALSSAPSASNIIVTNNAGIDDTVQVTGLSANDIVDVYDSAQGGNLLGTSTVGSTGEGTTVSIPQLGSTAGSIYVSVTSTNKNESVRTQVGFAAEASSTAPVANNITIVNNAGIAGTVTVNGLSGNDVVNVYDSAQGSNLLGTSTVEKYGTQATVSVANLSANGGNVYVSVTSTGKLESVRTEAAYSSELVSATPNADNITVVNNAGIASTVTVSNLQPNDIVNLYDSAQGGNLLGTVTVAANSMNVTASTTQLNASGGTIYVSVTSTGKTESSRTAVQYNAQSQSYALDSGDIVIANNSGSADTVTVTGVATNDVVNIYSAATGGTLLGTATVSSDNSGAVITVPQLGTDAGSVYVSVIRYGMTESTRTKVDYAAVSMAPLVGNISIVNNAVIADTVTVTGLSANDVVNVYDSETGGNLLGCADVPSNSNEVTITIPQLGIDAGSVYVSVTNSGSTESNRTKADYIAEQSSAALYPGNISIVNNPVGTTSVITVSNLSPNDFIKVYDASVGGDLLGTATVSSNGTQVTINTTQLNTYGGSVYVSITKYGKNESNRTEADYVAAN
jgi:hypothetical protein